MNETEKPKKKFSKLALWSPGLLLIAIAMAFLILMGGFLELIPSSPFFSDLIIAISAILFFAAPCLGIYSIFKIFRSKGKLKGYLFSILGVVLSIIFVGPMFIFSSDSSPQAICGSNIRSIGTAIRTYSKGHNNQYPEAKNWCELIEGKYIIEEEGYFKCPSSETGRCSYAINPNCRPDSPDNIVLLFETKGGWNQFGGAELLTTENHEDKGAYVLFNNGLAEFVETNDLDKLKWK